MHTSWFHRLLLTSLIALAVLAPASSAFAGKPTTTTEVLTIQDTIVGNCGDFDIVENAEVIVRETTFFNQEGEPARIQVNLRYRGTLSNSETGKTIVDAPDPQTIVTDLQDDTVTIHGLVFRITIPGEGIVVLDAGTIIFHPDDTVTIHGPHQIFEEGYLELICPLLA